MSRLPIFISDEVLEKIRARAKPGETPETVLRRVFKLPHKPQGRRSARLKPFDDNGAAP